jgi:hypothetical protein
MQQRSDRRRRKFAPLNANAFSILTRHISPYDDGLMPRPRVRQQSDLEPALGSNQHRGFDVGATDAQISQPAVSFGEGVRHESNRKIDLYPFSPAVIHESYFHGEAPRRIREAAQLRRDNSYSGASIPRQQSRSQRMISTASPITNEQVRSKSAPAQSTIARLCTCLPTSTKHGLMFCTR